MTIASKNLEGYRYNHKQYCPRFNKSQSLYQLIYVTIFCLIALHLEQNSGSQGHNVNNVTAASVQIPQLGNEKNQQRSFPHRSRRGNSEPATDKTHSHTHNIDNLSIRRIFGRVKPPRTPCIQRSERGRGDRDTTDIYRTRWNLKISGNLEIISEKLLLYQCIELSRFHAHTESFTVYHTKNHKHMESRQVNFEESLPILTGRHTHMHMLARASSRLYKLGNVTSSPF